MPQDFAIPHHKIIFLIIQYKAFNNTPFEYLFKIKKPVELPPYFPPEPEPTTESKPTPALDLALSFNPQPITAVSVASTAMVAQSDALTSMLAAMA